MKIDLNTVFKISEDLITRSIEGEMVIVPLESGMGDLNDDLFSLNQTGSDIWNRIDGETPVKVIIQDLAEEYNASVEEITPDILDLILKMIEKKLIITIK